MGSNSHVTVLVHVAFDERAAREALAAGHRPERDREFELDPADPEWHQAVALLPGITDGESVQHLWVAQVHEVRLECDKPYLEDFGSAAAVRKVVRWPYPRITVERFRAATPLSEWMTEPSDIIMAASRAEGAIHDQVRSLLDGLVSATAKWIEALPDELARIDEQVEAWSQEAKPYDQLETTQQKLRALRSAATRLEHVTAHGTEGLLVQEEIEVPQCVALDVAALEPRVVAAAGHLDRAFDALRLDLAQVWKFLADQDRRDQELKEVTEWVLAHGSARLRMAVDAGLLGTALGAYRDERIAAERPGWMWVARDDGPSSHVVNPSEQSLTAFLAERKVDPNVQLGWHPGANVQVLLSMFLGRQIWKPADPDWNDKRLARHGARVVRVEDLFPSDAGTEPF